MVAVTKRNLISEAILFVFTVLQADVTKPGLATSKSAKHTFGMCRTIFQEFTTMDFTEITEKVTHRLSIMFCSVFKHPVIAIRLSMHRHLLTLLLWDKTRIV